MGAQPSSKRLHRPTISVSVPPAQQEAFYHALLRLKQEGDAAFVSASALIVKAVIHYAAALDAPDAPDGTYERSPEETHVRPL